MKISGVEKESWRNFPTKQSYVMFTKECNFNCGYCHAKHVREQTNLIDEKEIFEYLDGRKGWIDGVVLCGGEPTLQPDISDFAKKLKDKGLAVKLDTNGANPDVVKRLLKDGTIDYVAMDVKGPKELYPLITGTNVDIKKLEESMNLVQFFPKYEFRTTVIPIMRDYGTNFMTIDDVVKTAEWINSATRSSRHKYYLQTFYARPKEEMIDERLSSDVLPKEFHETPQSLLVSMKEKVSKILTGCEIR